MRKGIVYLIILLIIGVVIYRYFFYRKVEKFEVGKVTGLPVKLSQVNVGDITKFVDVSGTITARKIVKVYPKIPGRVERIYFNEGDYVKKGQLLIKLEDDDIIARVNQAEAALLMANAQLKKALTGAREQQKKQVDQQVTQAKAALDVAKSNYERMKILYDKGAISKQQFELTEMQYKQAEAGYQMALEQQDLVYEGAQKEDIETAYAAVAQAEAAVKAARVTLKDTNIYAPIDGIVSEKNVEVGEMIMPGISSPMSQSPLTIVDNRYVDLEVEVGEKDIKAIREGMKVDIRIDALPDKQFIGYVDEIIRAASEVTRAFKVKIKIENIGLELKQGMFARGKIEIERHKDVVLIPREVVQERRGKKVVFKIENNKAKMIEIKLGLHDEKNYEVVTGLSKGDKIVTTGQENLDEGVLVEVVK